MTTEKLKQITFRNEYVNDLKQFINSSKYQVKETLLNLNWCEERTTFKENERELTTCPLNEAHRVSLKNLAKHEETCSWHLQGYTDDDVPFPSSGASSIASVKIDKTLQEKIIANTAAKNPSFKIGANVRSRGVPQTSDRLLCDFTTDERKALYDYVIAQTAGQLPELKEFSLPSQSEGKSEMTREQLMAVERDAKRRRAKYRTTKVKGRNFSEMMREVINNQMQSYEDWLKEQRGTFSESPSGIELDGKQTTVEPKNEKQEMIWIDCDKRVNPYLRWKYILEKEKRRAEEKKNTEKCDSRKDERNKRKEKEDDSKRRSERNDDVYRGQEKRRRYDDHHEKNRERDKYKYENDRHRNDRKEHSKSYEKDRYRRESYSSHDRTRKEQSYVRSEKDKHKSYEVSNKRRDLENCQENVQRRSRQKSEDKEQPSKLDLSKVKNELNSNAEDSFNNEDRLLEMELLYKRLLLKEAKEDVKSSSEEELSKASKHKKKHRKSKKAKKHKYKSKKKKKTSDKSSSNDCSESSTDDPNSK